MTSDAHGNVVGSPRMTKKRALAGGRHGSVRVSTAHDTVTRARPQPLEAMKTGAEITRSSFGQRPAALLALIVEHKQNRQQ